METTIDRAGRLVLPKALRVALGLIDGGRVEITEGDGHVTIRPVPAAKHLSTSASGHLVCIAEGEMPTLSVEAVREALEGGRR